MLVARLSIHPLADLGDFARKRTVLQNMLYNFCECPLITQKRIHLEGWCSMSFSVSDGAWPILLTPFTADNQIDFDGLDSLLVFYQQVAVPGILALGQASEVLGLTDKERFEVAAHV